VGPFVIRADAVLGGVAGAERTVEILAAEPLTTSDGPPAVAFV
jgi:hypothetical protein